MNTTVLVAVLLSTVVSGCASLRTSPRPVPMNEPEVADVQRRLKATVLEELAKQPGSSLNELEILDATRSTDGSMQVVYRASFDTDSEENGRVTHILESEALIRPQTEQWMLEQVIPQKQTLVYHRALVISTPTPNAGGTTVE